MTPGAGISSWKLHKMGGNGKRWHGPQRFVDPNQVPPFAGLWNAKKGSIEQRVANLIAKKIQVFCYGFSYLISSVVENIGDILHHDGDGLKSLNPSDIGCPELTARILAICLWVFSNLAQLGASDAGIRLTGWTTNQYVNVGDSLTGQLPNLGQGLQDGHVAAFTVNLLGLRPQMAMEISRMGLGS